MKRWLIVFALLFVGHDSFAGVSCSVPFNLTNGSNADASQVMANYNAILACLLNNTAESGANASITSLSGLTTPLSPAQGGTTSFTGGTSVGTNAITATASPASFVLTLGYKITFVAGGANSAATTLNVSGTGVKNLFRPTQLGAVSMVGGEIVAGQIVEVAYDGTQYQMVSKPALDMPPGAVFDYAGASGCPAGSLLANGGATALAALTAILGTTWGVSGTLPDLRGRATFSADSGGSGRITAAGGNFDGTVVGGAGGQQSSVVAKANLAAFALNVTDPGHTHSASSGQFQVSAASGNGGVGAGANQYGLGGTTVTSATTGVTVASGGSSTPLPTLSNAAIVLKCVKS